MNGKNTSVLGKRTLENVNTVANLWTKQECIPVGCVPAASWPNPVVLRGGLPTPWMQILWSCDLWCMLGSHPPPPPWTEWLTGVKTLLCPKLRLQVVKNASMATTCTVRGGPRVKKFEQVFSDGHKMSQARGPVSGVGTLYSEIQCIMSNGHMGPPPLNRMTDTCDNNTYPQLCWAATKVLDASCHHELLVLR